MELKLHKTVKIVENVASCPVMHKTLPKVTIVTPSFNQGQFIQATIDSVLNQSYPNIEYMVIDGGSTDDTVAILKSYGNRINWVSEPDEGQADAVNKGINRTSGEIIGWLNSDDTYYPSAVEEAVNFLLAYENVGVVYGDGMHVDKEGNNMAIYPSEVYEWKRLADTCFICQPAAFFRREVVKKVGGLCKELQMCMDYDFWIRLGKITKFVYVPSLWATSRMYKENKTLGKREFVYREIMRVVKSHYRYLPFSWIYGYWHYRFNGTNPKIRLIISLVHLVFVNIMKPHRILEDLRNNANKSSFYLTLKKLGWNIFGRNR